MKYAKSDAPKSGTSSACLRCTAKSSGLKTFHEYALPKPKGKEAQDDNKAKERQLSYKQYTNVVESGAKKRQ